MKITIVGAGNVGATTAQRISSFELASEVVIVDVANGIPHGKALDIYQSGPLVESDCRVIGTNGYEQTADSDIVVITAGMSRRPGMTHDDLLAKNAEIVRGVTQKIVQYSRDCIIIMVSSPLDEMTYVTLRASGFDRSRVIGMAGVLDTARLKTFIAMELNVAVEDVEATVLGGHGEAMVPLVRNTTVAGVPLAQLASPEKIEAIVQRTRQAGTEIINLLKTSSAFYAPSAAVTAMIEAIVKNKPRIMPCAVRLDGEYGLNDVVTGVPIKLGSKGVDQIIELDLLDDEREGLRRSAERVKNNLAKLSW
jgi:malate dehydrogenase